GRHLIGGPVPAWVPTVAIAAAAMLLFHYIIVGFNLRGVFSTNGSVVLKFAAAGFAGYLLTGIGDAVFAMRGPALVTHFTYFEQAQLQLALASFSLVVFAAVYYLAPR